MDIEKHNFESAKKKIKSFAEKLPANPRLNRVSEDAGPFGWFDHDVSGKELNELTSQIQDCLVSNNKNIRKTIQEFKVIYETLEYLDKDYLAGIVASVRAAEAASGVAKENTEKLDIAQQDIKKNLVATQKIVKKLGDFKKNTEKSIIQINEFVDKLGKQKHLYDIDKLWNSNQELQASTREAYEKMVADNGECLKKIRAVEQEVSLFKVFSETLKKQKHLHNIDELWLFSQNLSTGMNQKYGELISLLEENNKKALEIEQSLSQEITTGRKKMFKSLIAAYALSFAAVVISVCSLFF